jgi:hypothetical protein
MTPKLAAGVFLVSVTIACAAAADDASAPVTAKQMLDACTSPRVLDEAQDDCAWHLDRRINRFQNADLLDAMTADTSGALVSDSNKRAYCVPAEFFQNPSRKYEAVRLWLGDHSETWPTPSDDAIKQAMNALWGCKK